MEKQVLQFKKSKETKRCSVFEEQPTEGKPPVVGTLYVQKWAAGSTTTLQVTIEGK